MALYLFVKECFSKSFTVMKANFYSSVSRFEFLENNSIIFVKKTKTKTNYFIGISLRYVYLRFRTYLVDNSIILMKLRV